MRFTSIPKRITRPAVNSLLQELQNGVNAGWNPSVIDIESRSMSELPVKSLARKRSGLAVTNSNTLVAGGSSFYMLEYTRMEIESSLTEVADGLPVFGVSYLAAFATNGSPAPIKPTKMCIGYTHDGSTWHGHEDSIVRLNNAYAASLVWNNIDHSQVVHPILGSSPYGHKYVAYDKPAKTMAAFGGYETILSGVKAVALFVDMAISGNMVCASTSGRATIMR